MSIGEAALPGAIARVAVAVTHGDQPQIVLATDQEVLSRAVALQLVARTTPGEIGEGSVERIRNALLEERWADAVSEWMTATGEVLDGYPDEPVWSDRQLDEERTSLELRLTPIFHD